MMDSQSPLYWLLEVDTYEYDVGVFKNTDLTGKVLIASRQLWSIIRGDKVYSMLIGPGIFKGIAEEGNRRIEVIEPISSLMFDPTQLRFDEPVPVVDIVNPEVIDPLSAARPEELYSVIRKLVLEKGNILSADPLMTIQPDATVPKTAHYSEQLSKITISHVSGKQRARFILGGANGPLYKPFVQGFERRKYIDPERLKVMATPFSKFANFIDIEVMSDWMIVEKAGIDSTTGMEAIKSEYDKTMDLIKRNHDAFIYEL
jgi:hypothetical protein